MRTLLLLFSLGAALTAQTEFPQGVASGDVTPAAATLWTRANRETTLTLEINGEARQQISVTAESDFTAKVRVDSLTPATAYTYRWRDGDAVSEEGKFRTAPEPSAASRVKFAFSGDSDGTLVNGEPGVNKFEVLDAIRAENPDFFLYLGDTVYADSARRGARGPSATLEDYRENYRVNRGYEALRKLLAATSSYVQWDDHEVRNDYDAETVPKDLVAFGRQAFFEYMPVEVPATDATGCVGAPLYRTFRWGAAVELFILDERSCRSANAEPQCTISGQPRGDLAPTLPSLVRLLAGLPIAPPPGCLDAINRPNRTLLGAAQMAQFREALLKSTARFKLVISQVAISSLYAYPYDRWEGYGAERMGFIEFLRAQTNLRGVIFLTTDMHANIIQEVSTDRLTNAPTVTTEFITGPIATDTLQRELGAAGFPPALLGQFRGLLGADCAEFDTFGYGLVEVDPEAGSVTVSLKDASGNVLGTNGSCRRSITAPAP